MKGPFTGENFISLSLMEKNSSAESKPEDLIRGGLER